MSPGWQLALVDLVLRPTSASACSYTDIADSVCEGRVLGGPARRAPRPRVCPTI